MSRWKKVGPLAAVAALAGGAGAGIAAFADGSSAPAAVAVVTSARPAAATESSIGAAYRRTAAGVVEIVATGSSSAGGFGPFGDRSAQTESEGSGFVIDKAGDIVTNAHVIDGATSVAVRFSSGKTARATVVGSDDSTDIAVLHVAVDQSELTPLTLDDSASVEAGDTVIAIGSPFGLENSVTAGIASAVGRRIEAPNGATITGAIQTDAAINPGNSGGPLLDATGGVIGVNAQIRSSSNGNEGVGLAIPSDTVKTVVGRILAGAALGQAGS